MQNPDMATVQFRNAGDAVQIRDATASLYGTFRMKVKEQTRQALAALVRLMPLIIRLRYLRK